MDMPERVWSSVPGALEREVVSDFDREILPPPILHVLQFFEFDHLPPHLQEVSRPFAEMAGFLVSAIVWNPELTVMLRKLLETKDAAVRAKLVGDNDGKA